MSMVSTLARGAVIAAALIVSPAISWAWFSGIEPVAGNQPSCVETATMLAGRRDEFDTSDGIEAPSPDPISWARYNTVASPKNFDELSQGVVFHTFKALTATGEVCGARLEFRALPNPADSLVGNDSVRFYLGDGMVHWTGYLGTGNPGPALRASPWGSGLASAETFVVDLSLLPVVGGSTRDFLPELNRVGLIDVNLSDDTAFDFAELRIWSVVVPPTPTASAEPTPVPSPTPTAVTTVMPSPMPSDTPSAQPTCVCEQTRRRVPQVAIAHAIVNPTLYYGWRYPLDPGKPPGPANPLRECLSLSNPGSPYHPLYNSLVWRAGCR